MRQGNNSRHLDQRPNALVHAWDLLKLVVARFWGPVALGQLPGLAEWRVYDLLDWLRPIEPMLRRLSLLEALAIAPALPEPAASRLRALRRSRYKPVDPERSESWTGRFRNSQPARPGGPPSYLRLPPCRDGSFSKHLAIHDRANLRDAWALARRLEATIGVLSNPPPRISRLAHRIRRHGAPDPTRLTRPRKIRIPRTWPTLDALSAQLRLPPAPGPDTSRPTC